jgi:hypothetical protein
MGYETVDRPAPAANRHRRYDYDAIIATADTGKAVLIPLDGRTAATARAAIGSHLNFHGWSLRSKISGDQAHLIVWVERRK